MSKYYEIKGEKLVRKFKNCPKCGDGYFMGEHKDRLHCGKCDYTQKKK